MRLRVTGRRAGAGTTLARADSGGGLGRYVSQTVGSGDRWRHCRAGGRGIKLYGWLGDWGLSCLCARRAIGVARPRAEQRLRGMVVKERGTVGRGWGNQLTCFVGRPPNHEVRWLPRGERPNWGAMCAAIRDLHPTRRGVSSVARRRTRTKERKGRLQYQAGMRQQLYGQLVSKLS